MTFMVVGCLRESPPPSSPKEGLADLALFATQSRSSAGLQGSGRTGSLCPLTPTLCSASPALCYCTRARRASNASSRALEPCPVLRNLANSTTPLTPQDLLPDHWPDLLLRRAVLGWRDHHPERRARQELAVGQVVQDRLPDGRRCQPGHPSCWRGHGWLGRRHRQLSAV